MRERCPSGCSCVRCNYLNKAAKATRHKAVRQPKPAKPTEPRKPRQPRSNKPTGRPPGRPGAMALSPEQLERANYLHDNGMTWRQLGNYFEVDFSALRRRCVDTTTVDTFLGVQH